MMAMPLTLVVKLLTSAPVPSLLVLSAIALGSHPLAGVGLLTLPRGGFFPIGQRGRIRPEAGFAFQSMKVDDLGP
jgi:hypothetical protein